MAGEVEDADLQELLRTLIKKMLRRFNNADANNSDVIDLANIFLEYLKRQNGNNK